MNLRHHDLSTSQALVIDSFAASRSLLVAQLKDFGMGKVVQCASTTQARSRLEYEYFDVVLCEHHFDKSQTSGQDLVDDLRRNQLLRFSTVFVMVTAEATYAKVAEAAESALDGYLLKPHSANSLGERLYSARARKISLNEIFQAIDAEDFSSAANLCMARFEAKGPYWLYAARVGAELLLRTNQYDQAQTLYEAVIAAKALPWAKLGVARSMLSAGQTTKATRAIEGLLGEDPGYADAYDILGKAQFEQGKYEQALASYQMAASIAPNSITRSQNLGLMLYFVGDRTEAEKVLNHTVRIGIHSKLLDCQTLVQLGFLRLDTKDSKGLQRCLTDFTRVAERSTDTARIKRLTGILDTMMLIQTQQITQSVQAVRDFAKEIDTPGFDFESACNLLTLASVLAQRCIQLDEIDHTIDALGMRFCTSRPLSELLARSGIAYEIYSERIRKCQSKITKIAEKALASSLNGNPKAAAENLVMHGTATHNAKLIETAYLVLQRYEDKIDGHATLLATVQNLRTDFAQANSRAIMGESTRQAGSLILRTGSAARTRLGVPPAPATQGSP